MYTVIEDDTSGLVGKPGSEMDHWLNKPLHVSCLFVILVFCLI